MSVYYEARQGRLAAVGWTPGVVVRNGKTCQSCKGIRRAVREVKRLEAILRNEYTPHAQTKRYRRQLAAELAAARQERVRHG